jgi:hypothetical protein
VNCTARGLSSSYKRNTSREFYSPAYYRISQFPRGLYYLNCLLSSELPYPSPFAKAKRVKSPYYQSPLLSISVEKPLLSISVEKPLLSISVEKPLLSISVKKALIINLSENSIIRSSVIIFIHTNFFYIFVTVPVVVTTREF